jgi:hypothetical protein
MIAIPGIRLEAVALAGEPTTALDVTVRPDPGLAGQVTAEPTPVTHDLNW